jgi:hypothetical protein
MDIKPSITLLQEHSDHVWQLSTEVRKDLSKLRLALNEPDGLSASTELTLLAELAEVNSALFSIFYQRLQQFIKKDHRSKGLTS